MLDSKYNKYSMDLNDPDGTSRKYLPVGVRVIAFREMYPQGRIETSIFAKGENFCGVEANIYLYFKDKRPVASAHAEVKRNEYDSFDHLLEAAETKAVGRALAYAGFGTPLDYDISEREPVDTGVRQNQNTAPTIDEIVEDDESENKAAENPKPENKTKSAKSTKTPKATDKTASREKDDKEKPTENSSQQKEKAEANAGGTSDKPKKRTLTKELLQEARSFVCPTGEHKGKTLGEIMLIDKSCIEYFSKQLNDSKLVDYSKILVFYDQKINEEKNKRG